MGIKEFLTEHWKWVAIGVAVLAAIALLSSVMTSLYGAGMGVVAWYATRQRKHLGTQHTQAEEVLEEVEDNIQAELVRQGEADADLEVKVTAARSVETGELWDTTDVMVRPKLDE